MRYFIAVIFSSLLLLSCGMGGWRVVDGGDFTIEFPGQPQDTATMEGDYHGAKLFFEPVTGGLDSNIYYSISVYALNDSVELLGDQLDDMLLKDAEIFAWGIGAMVTDSGKKVMSGKTEGYEYAIFLARNAGVATMRKFARGKKIYTLLVVTDNQHLNNASIRRFMDSFKLK